MHHGGSFLVGVDHPNVIKRVSLIRLPSTTHAYDMNQNFQWLSILGRTRNGLRIGIPASANTLAPGFYYLTVVNSAGVPSISRIVQIQ